jgi:hypothetical protein
MRLLFILLLVAVVAEMSGLTGRAHPHRYVILTDTRAQPAHRAPQQGAVHR